MAFEVQNELFPPPLGLEKTSRQTPMSGVPSKLQVILSAKGPGPQFHKAYLESPTSIT